MWGMERRNRLWDWIVRLCAGICKFNHYRGLPCVKQCKFGRITKSKGCDQPWCNGIKLTVFLPNPNAYQDVLFWFKISCHHKNHIGSLVKILPFYEPNSFHWFLTFAGEDLTIFYSPSQSYLLYNYCHQFFSLHYYSSSSTLLFPLVALSTYYC